MACPWRRRGRRRAGGRAGGQVRYGFSAPGRRGLSAPSSGHPTGCLDNGPRWGDPGCTPGVAEALGHVPRWDAILLLAQSRGLSSPEAWSQAPAQRRCFLGWGSPGTELRGPGNLPDLTPDTKAQGHRAASAVYKCLLFTGVFVNGLLFPLLGQGIRIQRRGL